MSNDVGSSRRGRPRLDSSVRRSDFDRRVTLELGIGVDDEVSIRAAGALDYSSVIVGVVIGVWWVSGLDFVACMPAITTTTAASTTNSGCCGHANEYSQRRLLFLHTWLANVSVANRRHSTEIAPVSNSRVLLCVFGSP